MHTTPRHLLTLHSPTQPQPDRNANSVLLWTLSTCQQPYFYLGPVTPVQLLSRVVGGLRPRVDKGSMPPELVELMGWVNGCFPVMLNACLPTDTLSCRADKHAYAY